MKRNKIIIQIRGVDEIWSDEDKEKWLKKLNRQYPDFFNRGGWPPQSVLTLNPIKGFETTPNHF
jgi:hypothetical protein